MTWSGSALEFYGVKINLQILIYSCFYSFRKCVVSGIFRRKIINENPVLVWVNNPVFPHSGGAVLKQFGEVVCAPAARRDNLNNPCLLYTSQWED